ncbi:MAG: hypothetical protein JWO74_1449 [Solirubrobacterales bacterium]|jgi:hypothetical protein|nr:hypothetical protein [Solirubrobacterales bacterium]
MWHSAKARVWRITSVVAVIAVVIEALGAGEKW